MAKRQKRRTISLAPAYHVALTAYSTQIGEPISRIVERLIHDELATAGLVALAQKRTGVDKYWDPEVKRWRVRGRSQLFTG